MSNKISHDYMVLKDTNNHFIFFNAMHVPFSFILSTQDKARRNFFLAASLLSTVSLPGIISLLERVSLSDYVSIG